MSLIIQKYGGSSVADIEKIRFVAKKISDFHSLGNKLVVVVSAMGDTTDKLLSLAHKLTENPNKRELDMLLATGEQISIALLGIELHRLGKDAISLTGAQVGIRTDNTYTKARVIQIDTKTIKKHLAKNRIVIVAGFQGVDAEDNITTLGRGGSDITAVALASALRADLCEIYTDVDGVYTADPRIVANSQRLEQITYDEMLELASLGAKVLHSRSVEFAKKYNVKLKVLCTFKSNGGTYIVNRIKDMESQRLVTGVASKDNEAKVTILDVPDVPGVAAKIFTALSDKKINVNLISQSASPTGRNDISFTIEQTDLPETKNVMEKVLSEVKGKKIQIDKNIGIVSIVGVGMVSHPGVASKMFKILAENNINIQMISTSEIKISCVISRPLLKKAVKALHTGFGLDKR